MSGMELFVLILTGLGAGVGLFTARDIFYSAAKKK